MVELLNWFDIRHDVVTLTKEENFLMNEFVKVFPITKWGRIDWEKVENKVNIVNEDTDLIKDVLISQGFDLSLDAYLMYGYGDYPFVKTSVQRILINLEELRWIGTDQFIYCPTSKYVIEYFHDGEITIGWY